jgi:hypothetical protein
VHRQVSAERSQIGGSSPASPTHISHQSIGDSTAGKSASPDFRDSIEPQAVQQTAPTEAQHPTHENTIAAQSPRGPLEQVTNETRVESQSAEPHLKSAMGGRGSHPINGDDRIHVAQAADADIVWPIETVPVHRSSTEPRLLHRKTIPEGPVSTHETLVTSSPGGAPGTVVGGSSVHHERAEPRLLHRKAIPEAPLSGESTIQRPASPGGDATPTLNPSPATHESTDRQLVHHPSPATHESTDRQLVHRELAPESQHTDHGGTHPRSIDAPPVTSTATVKNESAELGILHREILPEIQHFAQESTTDEAYSPVATSAVTNTPSITGQQDSTQQLAYHAVPPEAPPQTRESTIQPNLREGGLAQGVSPPPVHREFTALQSLHRSISADVPSPAQDSAIKADGGNVVKPAPAGDESTWSQSLNRAATPELQHPTYRDAVPISHPGAAKYGEPMNSGSPHASRETPLLFPETSPEMPHVGGAAQGTITHLSKPTGVGITQPTDNTTPLGRPSNPSPTDLRGRSGEPGAHNPTHESAVYLSRSPAGGPERAASTPPSRLEHAEPNVLHRKLSPHRSPESNASSETAKEPSRGTISESAGPHALNEADPGHRTSGVNDATDGVGFAVRSRNPEFSRTFATTGPLYVSEPGTDPSRPVGTMAWRQSAVALAHSRPTDNTPTLGRPQLLHSEITRTGVASAARRHTAVNSNRAAIIDNAIQRRGSSGMVHRLGNSILTNGDGAIQRAEAPNATPSVAPSSGAVPPVYNPASKPGMSEFEVRQLADRVYSLLVRRLSSEKDRRGLSDAL